MLLTASLPIAKNNSRLYSLKPAKFFKIIAVFLKLAILKRNLIFCGFISVGLFSCTNSLEKKAYIQWVQDPKNGLHAIKESNGFVFDLQYQPSDYRWLQRSEGGRRTERQLDEIQHYQLTIGPSNPQLDLIENNNRDSFEKQKKLYYFSYSFQNDIRLEENGKIFPCVLFHFERQRDLKGSRTFLLGFEGYGKKSGEAKIVIQSEQFGSLPIRIKIVKKNIPSLQIQ